MASKTVMIEWGMPIQGRELKALEVFASSVAYWTKLQEDSKIENFGTFGNLTGNMSARAGFAILNGTDEQIDTLIDGEEWRSFLTDILVIGNNVQVNLLETGEKMQTRMERYAKSVKKIG
jgi:hypothetical protein